MAAARILLVEDDPDLAASVAAILEEEGHEVTIADDGATALACADPAPALALIDYHLPGTPSGRALVEALRRRCGQRTRVVLLSGEPDLAWRADELGADGHLEKPFAIDA